MWIFFPIVFSRAFLKSWHNIGLCPSSGLWLFVDWRWIVARIQKNDNLCLQTNTQQFIATGRSEAEVALLCCPCHTHLPLCCGCHANLLQPRLGPNTASSLAAVVTWGYFKCSLLSLPSTRSFSHHPHHPPTSSPILPHSWYSRCFKHFSTRPPASSAAEPRTGPCPWTPLYYHIMRCA